MLSSRTVIKPGSKDKTERPFWISLACLMSTLIVSFLLVMSAILLPLTKTITDIERRQDEREQGLERFRNQIVKAASRYQGISLDKSQKVIDFEDKAQFKPESQVLREDRPKAQSFYAFVPAVPCCSTDLAANLRIGFKAEVTAADPHVINGQNRNVWIHVYESLVGQDDGLQAKPALATSWQSVDPLTWEFKLRPNVVFHDGSTLTSEDVKFSIDRAMNLAGPRTFRIYLKDVESVVAADPLTVLVKTKAVSPNLPDLLSLIAILPKSIGKNDAESAFATGKAAIGTGPYKFVEWVHGERVILAKNDKYWGEKEPWNTVAFQFIPKESVRAAALISGGVDVIDGATPNMGDAFKDVAKFETASIISYMLVYLQLDRFRKDSPFVKDNDGQPLGRNPFDDLKVRQALTLGINRDAIIQYVMKGDAQAAGQMVPAGFFGHDSALKPIANDVAKAKALLAEAGYPNGFRLTLHCPNDRYLNDAKACEALGQMFTRIGIKTEVKTLPFAVYTTRATAGGPGGEPEFSAFMFGIGAVTGDSLEPLLAMTKGRSSRGRYSNKEVDVLIEKAARTLNDHEREEAQKSAARLLMADVGIVPLYFLKASWVSNKGLVIKPRSDGFTLAMNIRERKGEK